MFRLKKAIGLIGAFLATSTFIGISPSAAIAQQSQPGVTQTRKPLPCPRPAETNSWGVRIARYPRLSMMRQSNLIASLVADVPGLATSRQCSWEKIEKGRALLILGWQIEVTTEQNALKLATAAQRYGMETSITRN